MTIHRLIQNLSFNQDDIDRLAAAYEDALRALHISDRDDPINEITAALHERNPPIRRVRCDR